MHFTLKLASLLCRKVLACVARLHHDSKSDFTSQILSRPTFFKPHHQVSITERCSNRSDALDYNFPRILEPFVFVKNIVVAFNDRSMRIRAPYRRSKCGHDRCIHRHGGVLPRIAHGMKRFVMSLMNTSNTVWHNLIGMYRRCSSERSYNGALL